MEKRNNPLQPLLIVDDRNKPDEADEAWIPAAQQLPINKNYGWSDQMVVCRFEPGDLRPSMIIASYDFDRHSWRSAMGEVPNVTYWQPLPDYPKEYQA